jgi:hypothetical protein
MKKQGLWLTILKIGVWACLANAVTFLLVAAGSALNTTIFLARSVRTDGTITAFAQSVDDDGSVSYFPVFTFVTRDGKGQTVQSHTGSGTLGFEVGDRVPVRYELVDPSTARIDTFWQTWPLAMLFAIGACLMGLSGWFLRWRIHKKLTKPPKLKRIPSLDVV